MKTVLFVPGSGEGLHARDYRAVLNAIKSKGYKAKFVPITWPRTTIDKWVTELAAVYGKYDPPDTILAGFSWGAMTSFAVAAERAPAELWLFSLSPYFMEDLGSLPKSWLTKIGHRRVSAFQNTSFSRLAAQIGCPVKLFAGERELRKWPATSRRFHDAAKKFKDCAMVIVPDAGHEIEHANYITALRENI